MWSWARRARALHGEIAEIADVARDPRWWLVAGGAALAWQDRDRYLASDAEPEGDTFIGHRIDHDVDPMLHALARAHAARLALRDLDGQLPEQPLAMTIRRDERGAVLRSSPLEVAAFAIGDRLLTHRLAPRFEDETGELVAASGVPFVCVTIGEEPVETARHGHRRAWVENGVAEGPWLGLGRTAGMDIVSTCHLVVDGYGHAWLSAQIAEHTRRLLADTSSTSTLRAPPSLISTLHAHVSRASAPRVETPRPVTRAESPRLVVGAIPLHVTWRELPSPAPRALRLAYALGRMLHRLAGERDAPFSPTFQIPVAPGEQDDSERVRRRVVPAIASVRFSGGVVEPYESFAIRTREILAREATGDGLSARLLAAAQAVPAPLAWKRRAVGPRRPGWLEPVANVVGGRGCVSRIQVDVVMPPSCAVSSPSRLASVDDPLGSCVVTVIDDGVHAAITLCGSGLAGEPSLLDELLALLPR
ncbi:MAG: hypothetical protein HOV81_08980 [Kofleriaceae bacterium]|nr:hypothetical protein [Kofleriaceae bacterium]